VSCVYFFVSRHAGAVGAREGHSVRLCYACDAMRSSATFSADNGAVLSLELREDEIRPYVESATGRLRSQVRIPGFRRGHVPRQVLEAKLGVSAIRSEAIEEAIGEVYEEAAVENGLDVIARPSLRIIEGQEGGDVKVEIDVKVRPTVSVDGYKEIEIEVPVVSLDDSYVDEVIDALREQSATVKEVERAALTGDQVTVNIIEKASEDKEEVVVTPYLTVLIGKGTLMKEDEEKLIGANVGDRREISPSPEGADRVVEILAVRELELAVADDDFAQQVSEFETIGELRADLLAKAIERRKEEAGAVFRSQLQSKLVDLVEPKELPTELVESVFQDRLHDFGHALEGSGLTLKRYMDATGQTDQMIAQTINRDAVVSILWDLGLRAVAVAEALECSEDEVEAEKQKALEQAGAARTALAERLSRPFSELEIRSSILTLKARKRLGSLVSIKDTEGIPVAVSELGVEGWYEKDDNEVSNQSPEEEPDQQGEPDDETV